MSNIYEGAVEVSRRTMTLFFIVDASGSMEDVYKRQSTDCATICRLR